MADKTILILAANPSDTSRLRLPEEVREIQEGLALSEGRDRFKVVSEWAVRPDDLRRAMLEYEPEFVHFSGHVEQASKAFCWKIMRVKQSQ